MLNKSDNEINLAKEFYGNIAMDIYPLGYHNIGERVHREDNNVKKMLKKDEQQEVIFAFIISVEVSERIEDGCERLLQSRHTGSYTLVTPKGKLYFAQLREMILLVS